MKFSKEQTDAISHVDGPMLVVAGPGSGKTTVIARRIKYLIESAGVSPADILVITYTRAAAGEMEQRFYKISSSSYRVTFGTFHSIFFWIIKTAYNLNNSCVISEIEKRNIVDGLLRKMSLQYENKEEVISSILSQVSLVKCDMLDIDSYYSTDMPEEQFRQLYKLLNQEMKKNRKIDFDDMMVVCYELLTSRKDILAKCRNIFKYIMVDEFQDCNKLQYVLLRLLAGDRGNVFVVGDDDQSVYGFRGARPEIMHQFVKDYPDAVQVVLGMNYRCDSDITRASSMLIGRNKKRFSKLLRSNNNDKGIVKVLYVRDDMEQINALLKNMDEHVKSGVSLENQAVLYRTNMQPGRLAIRLNRMGVPFCMKDAMPNLFEHFVIRGLLDYMRLAMGDCSRSVVLGIINKPGRYISRDVFVKDPVDFDDIRWRIRDKDYAVEKLDKLMYDLKLLRKMRPFAACNFIRKGIGFDDYVKWYSEQNNLDVTALEDIMDEFADLISDISSYGELFMFIEEYNNIHNDNSKEKKGINLMTFHSAKGLEFDVVYIIDFVEGVAPYKKAATAAELEEERRMVYVAMTRARHELYIYSPKQRGTREQSISRFAKDISEFIV